VLVELGGRVGHRARARRVQQRLEAAVQRALQLQEQLVPEVLALHARQLAPRARRVQRLLQLHHPQRVHQQLRVALRQALVAGHQPPQPGLQLGGDLADAGQPAAEVLHLRLAAAGARLPRGARGRDDALQQRQLLERLHQAAVVAQHRLHRRGALRQVHDVRQLVQHGRHVARRQRQLPYHVRVVDQRRALAADAARRRRMGREG